MRHATPKHHSDYYIPVENIDEPIEFYTMSQHFKLSDEVIYLSSGEAGTIGQVDLSSTLYPYRVDFTPTRFVWAKTSELGAVENATPERKDVSNKAILALVVLILAPYLLSLLGGCCAKAFGQERLVPVKNFKHVEEIRPYGKLAVHRAKAKSPAKKQSAHYRVPYRTQNKRP